VIAYGICIGSMEKYQRCAVPGIQRYAESGSPVAESTDNTSILPAYNEMLDAFAQYDDLEALVLMHEDLELRDEAFPRKVREAFADPDVAVVGLIGANNVPGLEWWKGQGVGRVAETRGVVDFGTRADTVDAVDGMLLALSPWAVRNLRFDSDTFSGFHAYDIDLCFQARAAGRGVRVIDAEAFHHTKGGFGDEVGFWLGDAAFRRKWDLPPAPVLAAAECPVCHVTLVAGPTNGKQQVQLCTECGLGATFPVPSIDMVSDELWSSTYADTRLARRQQWIHEATLRLSWLEQYVPDGRLLEVGSGTGEFVAVAQQHGFDAFGLEPSAWAAEQARMFGARVNAIDLRSWLVEHPATRYNAVAAFHVFEHLHEPRVFLREVRQALAPDGAVVFEVPNFDSIRARRKTFDWIGPALDGHVNHFTPRSLAKLFAEEGFAVELMLPITSRVYSTLEFWRHERRNWEREGLPGPPLDLLRVVARHLPDEAKSREPN
jgi:SAM-dependent methyltransferase